MSATVISPPVGSEFTSEEDAGTGYASEVDCSHWTVCSDESEPFADATHWDTTNGEARNG